MLIACIVIIVLLAIAVCFLTYSLFYLAKKTTYISDKDKEFIAFAIDMYVQYAGELKITSKAQHDKLVAELERIKLKYIQNNNKENDIKDS